MFGFDEPDPSLCDSCVFAYYVGGGSIGTGTVSGGWKNYRQRYCPKPPEGEEGQPVGRSIHTSGYQSCKYYQKKQPTIEERLEMKEMEER